MIPKIRIHDRHVCRMDCSRRRKGVVLRQVGRWRGCLSWPSLLVLRAEHQGSITGLARTTGTGPCETYDHGSSDATLRGRSPSGS